MSLSLQPDLTDSLEISTDRPIELSVPSAYRTQKAIVDRVVAFVLLVVISPVIVVLMALVRLTSRGPAVYNQVRLGLKGKPFYIHKLRSMRNECEKLTGPKWASKTGDPRVTTLGRFLRVSHLDELPQLWNVLRGDMSLVGPRPERPEFVGMLVLSVPNYRDRMDVLPGITGLAQVQLPADEDIQDVRHKVRCDICYMHYMSAGLDFKILVGTVLKIAGIPLPSISKILSLPGRANAS